MRARTMMAAALVLAGPAAAAADGIRTGCEGFEEPLFIPQPTGKTIVDIPAGEALPLDLRLVEIDVGEPAAAGAYMLLYVVDYPELACHVIHAGDADAGARPLGFHAVLMDRAFHRDNRSAGRVEIFVPVTQYPFAGEEDYRARIVEIIVGGDGVPALVE